MYMIKPYYRNHLKSANIHISCHLGKSAKKPTGLFGFSVLHLIQVFLYNNHAKCMNNFRTGLLYFDGGQ